MTCIICTFITQNYIYQKFVIMFQNLNEEQIESVISENIVCRLGCHADDKTYVVPVSYAYDGKYIYVRTFEGLVCHE